MAENGQTTVGKLAEALGVTHQLISRHRYKPGALPLEDVEGWRAYFQRTRANGAISPKIADKIALQNLKIKELVVAKGEDEAKVRRGEYIKSSEVRKVAQSIMSFLAGELERWRQTFPALLKGRGETEIFIELDRESAKLIDGLKARLKE